MFGRRQYRQRGFTLLEVMISVAILATLTVSISQMLKGSFDLRLSLSRETGLTHRINSLLGFLVRDLEHIHVLDSKDLDRSTTTRNAKTFFRLEKFGDDTLKFTTMSHESIQKNAKEGELVMVYYGLKEDPERPGIKSLVRGVYKEFSEEPRDFEELEEFIPGVKTFDVQAWDGERWSQDKWDSGSSDKSNKVPYMIRVIIEFWPDLDKEELEEDEYAERVDTVIFIGGATQFEQVKKPVKNIRYF
jgi:general secretion pathway protein J